MDKRRQQRLFLTLRRVALPVAIAVISATLAGAFVQLVPQFNRWEAGSVTDSQSVAKTARADDRISLIVIDNTTVNRLKLNGSTRALFAKYAELIRGLREAGAKVLVIDLLFDESMVGSELLTEALVNSKPLGVTVLTNASPQEDPKDIDGDQRRYSFPRPSFFPQRPPPNVVLTQAISMSVSDSTVLGAILVRTDLRTGKPILYSALAATLLLQGTDVEGVELDREAHLITAGSLEWQLGKNQQMMAQWTEKLNQFPETEFSDALRALRGPMGAGLFRGKVVILGNIASNEDVHPIGKFGNEYGVRFLAQMVNTLLLSHRARWTQTGLAENWALWFILGIAASAVALEFRPLAAWSACIGLAVVAITLPFAAIRAGMEIGFVPPVLAVLLASILAAMIRSTFNLKSDLRPTGLTEETTILFVDIQDSTGLTHKLGANKYHELHESLNALGDEIVRKHKGTIERTTGDGFMAVFRASRSLDHAVNALRSSVQLQEALASKLRSAAAPVATVSCGLETGVTSGGYVWESGRRVWSSTGNAVNLAQRLQSCCRDIGISVAIGPTAAKLIEHEVPVRLVGTRTLKGIMGEVAIFTTN